MTALVGRVPVERISEQARQAHPGRGAAGVGAGSRELRASLRPVAAVATAATAMASREGSLSATAEVPSSMVTTCMKT